jgi:GNAT superfamily N-acetyltransferase
MGKIILKCNKKTTENLKNHYKEEIMKGNDGIMNNEAVKCNTYDIYIDRIVEGIINFYIDKEKIYISYVEVFNQKKGYGSQVINHLKKLKKEIEIISEFKNIGFWKKMGFSVTHIIEFSNEINVKMKY